MKLKYHEWKCVGCGETKRFTGRDIFSDVPYWFTISAGGCRSSSDQPSFDTCACSIACLEKSASIIDGHIKDGKGYLIPNRKEITATICDRCGKVAKVDALNMIIGPGPLRNWTWASDPSGRKDFCCAECKKSNALHPEESIFHGLKFENPWDIARLIKAIDAPDFKEAIMPRKIIFRQVPDIKEAIRLANGGAEETTKPKSGRRLSDKTLKKLGEAINDSVERGDVRRDLELEHSSEKPKSES